MNISKQNGALVVPDQPTIPFIEGDGVGKEISPIMRETVDAAVEKCYGGKRKIEWREVLAGGKAHEQTGEWLPSGHDGCFP
jgi:isocitrate dehydrogenase